MIDMETHSASPLFIDMGTGKRWGEADSDPLADIQRFREQMLEASRAFTTLIISVRTLNRILRGTRSKRSWRRYRGRLKEQRRRGM